jgi:eukaryotic-like serine/threonine-protein kinase
LNLTAILAGVYALQKKYVEAEATAARVLGKPNSWKTLSPNVLPFAVRSLGASYRNDGRFADAERHFRTLVPLVLDNPGDAAPQTRIDLLLLADTYSSLGRYADADRWFTRLLEANRRVSGPEQLTLVTTTALGWARLQQERYADAERTLREVSETLVRTLPESWERFNVASMLGASLAGQQRFAEAEPLLIAGYEGMATRKPASNQNLRSRFTQRDAGAAILQLFSAAGNAAKRAEWVGRIDGATRKE